MEKGAESTNVLGVRGTAGGGAQGHTAGVSRATLGSSGQLNMVASLQVTQK